MKSKGETGTDEESPWSLLHRAAAKLLEPITKSTIELFNRRADQESKIVPPKTRSAAELLDIGKSMKMPTAESRFRYLSSDLKQFGPYNAEELRRELQSGHINPETFVNIDGAADWYPIWLIPGGICPTAVVTAKITALRAEIRSEYEHQLKQLQDSFERAPLNCLEKFVKDFQAAFIREWVGMPREEHMLKPPHEFRARLGEVKESRVKGVLTFSGPISSMNETPRKYEIVFASSDGIWAPVNAHADCSAKNSMFKNETDFLDMASMISTQVQSRLMNPPII